MLIFVISIGFPHANPQLSFNGFYFYFGTSTDHSLELCEVALFFWYLKQSNFLAFLKSAHICNFNRVCACESSAILQRILFSFGTSTDHALELCDVASFIRYLKNKSNFVGIFEKKCSYCFIFIRGIVNSNYYLFVFQLLQLY